MGLGIALFKVVTLLTGSAIAGEAIALLVGMVMLSPQPNSWITWRNILLLILDIICGIGMIGLMLLWRGNFRNILLSGLVVIAFSSHAYRDWEYFLSKTDDRFLINNPLFVLNNVKLIGVVVIAAIILISHFG